MIPKKTFNNDKDLHFAMFSNNSKDFFVTWLGKEELGVIHKEKLERFSLLHVAVFCDTCLFTLVYYIH